MDCPTATLDQAKTPSSLPKEEGANADRPETRRLHGFLRKTLKVVIVVRKCCVNVGTVEVKVVHPRPSVKGWDMTPVMQSSVNCACEEPLLPRRGVWENCASHG